MEIEIEIAEGTGLRRLQVETVIAVVLFVCVVLFNMEWRW